MVVLVEYIKNSIKASFFDDEALDYIDENVNWKLVYFVSLFVGLFNCLINYITTGNFFYIILENNLLNLIISIILFFFGSFIILGLFHLLLKLFGGKGTYLNTFKFGLTIGLPYSCFFILLTLILNLTSSKLIFILLNTFNIVFILWILILEIGIYSVIHQISKLRVFFALFGIPILLFIVSIISILFLINSAVDLQSNALDVGRQAQDKISTDLEITQVYVVDTSDGEINSGVDNLSITTRLGSGSNSIDLSELLIKIDSSSQGTMNYLFESSNIEDSTYIVNYLVNGSQHLEGYISSGDVIEFTMQISSGIKILEDDSLIIRMIPKLGVIKPLEITIPFELIDSVTYLYP